MSGTNQKQTQFPTIGSPPERWTLGYFGPGRTEPTKLFWVRALGDVAGNLAAVYFEPGAEVAVVDWGMGRAKVPVRALTDNGRKVEAVRAVGDLVVVGMRSQAEELESLAFALRRRCPGCDEGRQVMDCSACHVAHCRQCTTELGAETWLCSTCAADAERELEVTPEGGEFDQSPIGMEREGGRADEADWCAF